MRGSAVPGLRSPRGDVALLRPRALRGPVNVARFLLAGLFGLVIGLFVAFPGAGSGSGAAEGTASTGCTCHSMAANSGTTVTLQGLPATALPNTTYNLTITIDGPDALPAPAGQNEGGFALAVDVGELMPLDDKTQLRGTMLTHTAAGNDQRSWAVAWKAPMEGGNATFHFAGNAVNGDGVQNPVDAWNKAQATVMIATATGPSPTATTQEPVGDETPLPAWAALAGVGGAFMVLRRRA